MVQRRLMAFEFAEEIAVIAERRLGSRLAGIYVVGSASRDDVRPTSDVDVLAVVAEPFPTEHLADDLVGACGRCALRGLEAVFYLAQDLRPPQHPLPYLLNVNAGPQMHTHVSTGGDPPHWFLLDVAGNRDTAVALRGPALGSLAGQPARGDIIRALRASIRWHLDEGAQEANAVLGACRSLAYVRTGQWLSKTQAASVLVAARDAPLVVEEALKQRRAGYTAPLDALRAREFLDDVDQALEREREL